MAYFRKRSNYSKRRRNIRRKQAWRRKKSFKKRRGRLTTHKGFGTDPLPERLFTKLRYTTATTVAVAGSGSSVFNLTLLSPIMQSSLYDPEYTTGGHQPIFYDKLGGFYGKYKVYGMKYKYTLTNIDGTKPFCLLVDPDNTHVADTNDYLTVCERPHTKSRWGNGVYSNRPVVISGYASVARTYGVPKKDYRADAYYEGDWNTNPTRMAFLKAYVHTTDTSVVNMELKVEVVYFTELYFRLGREGGS